MGQLARTWAGTDPNATATCRSRSLPPGKGHDQAAQALAQQMAQTDPASAARWVDTIQDENMWRNTAQQVAFQWLRTDASAAKQWVAQSQLPAQFKTSFANQKTPEADVTIS